MNDLLGEVKGREGLGRRPASPAAAAAFDIEGGAPAANGRTADMDAFFKQVDDIKKDLTDIKALERQVIQMHDQSKTIVRQKDVQQHRADMQVSSASRRGSFMQAPAAVNSTSTGTSMSHPSSRDVQ